MAFGSDGSPSKALEGFCRKNAVAAADVTVEADGKGTEYVWAVVQQHGRAAAEVRSYMFTLYTCLPSVGLCTKCISTLFPLLSWARPLHCHTGRQHRGASTA